MPGETMQRAVAYARTASGKTVDQQAIRRQLRVCRHVAERLSATSEREFTDHGVSGLTPDREGLKALLAYVSANPIDYVICADASRLTRDYVLFMRLKRRMKAGDALIVFADRPNKPVLAMTRRRKRAAP